MGELLFQGRIDELHKLGPKEIHLRLKVNNTPAALFLIEKLYTAIEKDNDVDVVVESKDQVSKIIQQLVFNNVNIYEAAIKEASLENLFLSMTANHAVR